MTPNQKWDEIAGRADLNKHLVAEVERLKKERDCWIANAKALQDDYNKRESELTSLRKDKERLDWLSGGLVELRWRKVCSVSTNKMDLRQSIDAAITTGKEKGV